MSGLQPVVSILKEIELAIGFQYVIYSLKIINEEYRNMYQ